MTGAGEAITVGQTLPALTVSMTAQRIISGAVATRDWQPIHHDQALAQQSGLRGIILNAPSQAGWISKYITDWAGPSVRIQRLSFRMKDSICPGDTMQLSGEITACDVQPDGQRRMTASVHISVDDKLRTVAEVRFLLP